MAQAPFRVGDDVAVVRPWAVPEKFKIVRCMKLFVELNNGSKWRLDGRVYPLRGEDRSYITHWTEDHAQRRRLGAAARRTRALLRDLERGETLDVLALSKSIVAVLQEYEDSKRMPAPQAVTLADAVVDAKGKLADLLGQSLASDLDRGN